MSRHRDIRNLNIQDELDDDALSDVGEEPMTQEEEDQLYYALDQVREIIGSAQTSGISDKELKDCLWREYCDIPKSVKWALDMQDRRRVAQGQKEETDDSALEYWKSRNMGVNENLSRVPKIILAQQQAQQLAEQEGAYEEQPYLTIEDSERIESLIPRQYWTELSTITERTEFTEQAEHMTVPSPSWQSQTLPTLSCRGRGGADSSRTTSYGEELVDDSQTQPFFANILNEETSRQRPVSLQSSFVPSIRMSPATPTVPSSRNSLPQEKSLPDRPPSIASKKSKLASLASSRLSIALSSLPGSSRDDGTSLSGSIKTFPALRPSPFSDFAPSTVAHSVSSATSGDAPSRGTGASETTVQVQRAIQTALQLEAMDQNAIPPGKPKLTLARPQSPPPAKGVPMRSLQSTHSTPQQSPKFTLQNQRPSSEGLKSPSPPIRRMTHSPVTPGPQSPASSLPPAVDVPKAPASPAKSLSKLALLAQQKISASKAPKLPAPKTEYLVPTANGATATTAITTSYQSLFTLTDPKRPAFIPKLDVTPLPSATTTQTQNKSKLAMKVRKNGDKPTLKTPLEFEEPSATSLSPIFGSISHSRALPSAFASVLVRDDPLPFESSRRSYSQRQNGNRGSGSGPASHARKRDVIVSSLTPPSAFAFDSPSPDDIVFSARRGTSLAQSKHIKPATIS